MAPAINKNSDKTQLIFLISILLLIIAYFWLIAPMSEKKALNTRKLQQKKIELVELQTMEKELALLQDSASTLQKKLSKREENFSLFTFLDNTAGQTNIKSNITYMKPAYFQDTKTKLKISSVKMELKDIDMNSFFDYLYKIEHSDNFVFITKFMVKKETLKDTKVTVVMEVRTVSL